MMANPSKAEKLARKRIRRKLATLGALALNELDTDQVFPCAVKAGLVGKGARAPETCTELFSLAPGVWEEVEKLLKKLAIKNSTC